MFSPLNYMTTLSQKDDSSALAASKKKDLLVATKLLIMLHFISSRFLTVGDLTGKSTDPNCT
jgi:hypothetical protein